ncbi:MAG TPA: phage virion morphogenesis protein [Stellaceae bacterium]|nr:phage virion morphogenesis protein [Stellaceae bacterium]
MISLSIGGLEATTARLAALPETVAARLAVEVERLGGVLQDRVRRKLSGEVLRQRSGRLAGSISVAMERSGLAVAVTVGSDVPYAGIHEYGGVLPARGILPKSGRVLAFPWRGQQRFFCRVSLPAVTMPERSFLRSALEETTPEIRAAIEAAVQQAVMS